MWGQPRRDGAASVLALEPREAAALLERGGEAVGWHPGEGACLADAHWELSRSLDTADSQEARARVHRSFAPCAGCIGCARGHGRFFTRRCGSQLSHGTQCGFGSGGGFAAARPGLRTGTGQHVQPARSGASGGRTGICSCTYHYLEQLPAGLSPCSRHPLRLACRRTWLNVFRWSFERGGNTPHGLWPAVPTPSSWIPSPHRLQRPTHLVAQAPRRRIPGLDPLEDPPSKARWRTSR